MHILQMSISSRICSDSVKNMADCALHRVIGRFVVANILSSFQGFAFLLVKALVEQVVYSLFKFER